MHCRRRNDMVMYQKSILALADRTPAYLKKTVNHRVVVDTPGLTGESPDEYENDSFIASQEGTI